MKCGQTNTGPFFMFFNHLAFDFFLLKKIVHFKQTSNLFKYNSSFETIFSEFFVFKVPFSNLVRVVSKLVV